MVVGVAGKYHDYYDISVLVKAVKEYVLLARKVKMKPKNKILDYFRLVNENDRVKYVCVFCDAVYTCKNVTRFAKHIVSNCKLSPVEVKSGFKTTESVTNNTFNVSSNSEAENTHTTYNEKEIHKALARAVYVTGQPLSIFEHPLWKHALQLLRPEYTPPSRKMLSTTLLDEEYDEVKKNITEKIEQAEVLHLAMDGWTNIKKDSILNIILYTPKPYFHSYIDTETNRHTAEYLAEKVSETIDNLGADKFLGIISDNAANMKKCGKLVNEKYTNTTWIGCLGHTLNLLVGDIMKLNPIQEVFSFVVSVIKCVLHSNIFNAEFKKLAAEKSLNVTLIFPVKTRWGSYLYCLENFLKSKEILQIMAINENNRELQKYRANILNDNIWADVEKEIKLFKPIVDWITKLEGDSCTIHQVHGALEEIESLLRCSSTRAIFDEHEWTGLTKKFEDRKQNCLKPVHYAAVILNPKNQGATLNSEDHLEGFAFILNTAQCSTEVTLKELSDYKCRKGIWEKQFIWQTAAEVDAISWWQALFPNTNLGKTALKILSVPSTSASVERSFSTFSNIHTKKRNKLKTERAFKLCYIAHNWKLMNKSELEKVNPESAILMLEDEDDGNYSLDQIEEVDFRPSTDLMEVDETFDPFP